VVNITGQIVPVREIVELGRGRGIETIVDGAHSFAHFPFRRDDLRCDYFGTSLHKWLFAPKGTGMLYVRREKIEKIWPLMAAESKLAGDIRKFEEIGQHPQTSIAAIGPALDFYETLGVERKQARLHYLKRYWTDQLASNPRVRFNTSLDAAHSGATIHVTLDGLDARALSRYLLDERGIYALAIIREREGVHGIYVSPNVFTTLAQLDLFVEELSRVLKDGLPATTGL
jgi:selenocysteine lyase/cysteine desulfurase